MHFWHSQTISIPMQGTKPIVLESNIPRKTELEFEILKQQIKSIVMEIHTLEYRKKSKSKVFFLAFFSNQKSNTSNEIKDFFSLHFFYNIRRSFENLIKINLLGNYGEIRVPI